MVRTVTLDRYGMERAVIETFVAGHTTTILDRLHQILASSREQTPHDVFHRFAPYTARAMTARLAEAFAAAVAKDAFRSSKSATCLNAAQARANPVGESNA